MGSKYLPIVIVVDQNVVYLCSKIANLFIEQASFNSHARKNSWAYIVDNFYSSGFAAFFNFHLCFSRIVSDYTVILDIMNMNFIDRSFILLKKFLYSLLCTVAENRYISLFVASIFLQFTFNGLYV